MAFQSHSGVSSRAGTIPGQPGSRADVFAKTRLKCSSQKVSGGGGMPGRPHLEKWVKVIASSSSIPL